MMEGSALGKQMQWLAAFWNTLFLGVMPGLALLPCKVERGRGGKQVEATVYTDVAILIFLFLLLLRLHGCTGGRTVP
jgi:hypothetical protein